MKWLLVTGIVLAWLATCLFAVDQAELAYVTQFGRPVANLDGETDAGLHLKWPWPIQTVQRLDRRIQVFDLPPAELLTHDPQGGTIDRTLSVEASVVWRIAGREGIDRFIRSAGSLEQARSLLGQRIGSRLGAVIGSLPFEELVSVAEPQMVEARSKRLRERLLGPGETDPDLRKVVLDAYGVELIDIRLRRFNYPASVRPAIAERIISERARKAAEYQSEGQRRAADIASAAGREVAVIEANAKAEAQKIQDRANVEAERIRAKGAALDPEFFAFLQKLKTYQRILSESRDVLLLSSRNELFDLLLKPPRAREPGPAPDRKEGP